MIASLATNFQSDQQLFDALVLWMRPQSSIMSVAVDHKETVSPQL
jgi:hypothetical protein